VNDLVQGLRSVTTAQAAATGKAQPSEKLRKAAGDFETLLLSSLLEPLASGWSEAPGEAEEKEGNTYGYLASQAIGQALSAHGGLGIARMLLQKMSLNEGHLPSMPEGTSSAKGLVGSADHPIGRAPDTR
jgi:Rod binding domain-containing protein